MIKLLSYFRKSITLLSVPALLSLYSCNSHEYAGYVILNGKVITVNDHFDIAQAIAVRGDRILAVGTDEDIKKFIHEKTKIIDAGGRAIIPGLIESHLHPQEASLSELKEEIPDVHTINELLQWIRAQAEKKEDGEWIIFPKFFYTRLDDMRPPTLAELDAAAPKNPVFLDGSYGGVVNTAAYRISGINAAAKNDGLLRDPKTGKLNGLVKRAAFRLFKIPPADNFTREQREDTLAQMLKRYNRYGITSVTEGAGNQESLRMYRDLLQRGELTTRAFVNIILRKDADDNADSIVARIQKLDFKTGDGNEWVRTGALKIVLDGGILTGTAYLREPWGSKAAEVYGITDPDYRGVINYSYDELVPIVRAAAEGGWKFTAHCTGGGGVDRLLDAYDEVNKSIPLKGRRFSIIHGNFFTPESIRRMHELGVYADMQAAWFYKDADAMLDILGERRIKTFMPYKSLTASGVTVNGGSDHMVKFDADKSINPYNPFLAMGTMVTRKTEKGNVIVPGEAVSRKLALKTYTINNAYASFEETLKGSLEPGKLADIAILSGDILTCPADSIRNIRAELTMMGGKVVYTLGNLK